MPRVEGGQRSTQGGSFGERASESVWGTFTHFRSLRFPTEEHPAGDGGSGCVTHAPTGCCCDCGVSQLLADPQVRWQLERGVWTLLFLSMMHPCPHPRACDAWSHTARRLCKCDCVKDLEMGSVSWMAQVDPGPS